MLNPSFASIVRNSPIIPVLHMESIDDAVNVSRALYRGGIVNAEIVLRSSVALDCVAAVSEHVPEMNVGVGTLISQQQVKDAVTAGAKFLVSPSFTRALATTMLDTGLPILPGVVTPSEITQALELGINEVKFFPAQQYGGANAIKALSGVFSQVLFCPTGGVSPSNIADYFSIKNVFAVGGSWMVPKDIVANKNWQGITQLSRQALGLINSQNKFS